MSMVEKVARAINERNFCHIEEMPDGRKVVFYIEHDCDDMILHQVTLCDVGTIDLKLTMPADKWEADWPPNFAYGAARLLQEMEKLGLVSSDAALSNTREKDNG